VESTTATGGDGGPDHPESSDHKDAHPDRAVDGAAFLLGAVMAGVGQIGRHSVEAVHQQHPGDGERGKTCHPHETRTAAGERFHVWDSKWPPSLWSASDFTRQVDRADVGALLSIHATSLIAPRRPGA
jgi:hypothetical protein